MSGYASKAEVSSLTIFSVSLSNDVEKNMQLVRRISRESSPPCETIEAQGFEIRGVLKNASLMTCEHRKDGSRGNGWVPLLVSAIRDEVISLHCITYIRLVSILLNILQKARIRGFSIAILPIDADTRGASFSAAKLVN